MVRGGILREPRGTTGRRARRPPSSRRSGRWPGRAPCSRRRLRSWCRRCRARWRPVPTGLPTAAHFPQQARAVRAVPAYVIWVFESLEVPGQRGPHLSWKFETRVGGIDREFASSERTSDDGGNEERTAGGGRDPRSPPGGQIGIVRVRGALRPGSLQSPGCEVGHVAGLVDCLIEHDLIGWSGPESSQQVLVESGVAGESCHGTRSASRRARVHVPGWTAVR